MQDGNVNEAETAAFRKALKEPAWDEWLFKDTEPRAELLRLNGDFQKQVKDIRSKYGIEPVRYNNRQAAQEWLDTVYKNSKQQWDEYITYILFHAHLMPGWRSVINLYVVTDKFYAPPAVLIHDTPDDYNFPNLRLQINDQMSQQDLVKLMKHIQSWISNNDYRRRKKRMPYDYMPYYLLFYDLRSAGLDNAEIAETLRANFEGQSESYGPSFITTFVRNSLRWLDKQIEAQMS
jgi:hypothetical protein